MSYIEDIENYIPFNKEEEEERKLSLKYISENKDILYRRNKLIHLTTSAFIINQDKDKVLMIHHNIYDSWSWVGGHADGCDRSIDVAIKEMQEETGVEKYIVVDNKPISLNLLTVKSHYKNGEYVAPHIHLDLAYLFQVDEVEEVMIKDDENSDIKWILFEEVPIYSNEKHMIPIYNKIIARIESEYK